jgi:3-hydroxyacyl-CoA dehydrogenase
MIGASWTALFIANGIRTIVYDPREDAEKPLVKNIQLALTTLSKLARYQTLAPGETLQSFVTFTMNLDNAVHAADFIQENTPEILEVKLDLLRAIDRQGKAYHPNLQLNIRLPAVPTPTHLSAQCTQLPNWPPL